MNDDAICFESLGVRRGAGLSAPKVEIDSLIPGINVIFGPNASGKTTLAQAVQTLLWPTDTTLEKAKIEGHFCVGDAQWRVDFDGGRVSRQRAGSDVAEIPGLVPAYERDRYYLGLHELLEADGDSFAEFILRESAGGFDVSAAAGAREYSTSTPRRGKTARELEEAKRAWTDAKNEQAALRKEERQLDGLDRKLEEIDQARDRKQVVELAIEFHEADGRLQKAKQKLARFPEAMTEVRGDEDEDLVRLRQRIDDAEEELGAAQKIIDDCKAVVADSPMGDELDDKVLPRLDEYISRLQDLERRRQTLARERAEEQTRCDRARTLVAGGTAPEEAGDIDADALRKIQELAREGGRLSGKIWGYEVLADVLGEAESSGRVDELREGIGLLQRWLSSSEGQGRDERSEAPGATHIVVMVAAWVVAGVGVGLAALVNLLWLMLLVLAAALIWVFWILRRPQKRQPSGRRAVYRRDFEDFELEAPDAWTEKAVSARLDELVRQWSRESVQEEMARRWRSHDADRRQLESKYEAHQQKRRQLAQKLGVAVDDSAVETYWLVSNIYDWQQAKTEVEALDAKRGVVRQEIEGLLDTVDAILSPLGVGEIGDVATAQVAVDELRQDYSAFVDARRQLEAARDKEQAARRRRDEAAQELDEIFERLGIDGGDDRKLAQLCGKKEAFDEARTEVVAREQSAKARREKVSARAGSGESLVKTGVDVLRRELDELEQVVARRDEILRKREAIVTRIDAAKTSSNVEKKWATYEAKRDELQGERDDDYGRVIGGVLSNYVQQKTRDLSRPDVFHRARDLFSTITRGRYRLELNEGGDGARFRAVDETQKIGHSLDELSSGTRVQLLLAVRIAFVERQERGAVAPLILDETLANSDDDRAQAIMEAVERIARTGRQILYFTAQYDEVQKWQSLVCDTDVECRFVDLGEATGSVTPENRVGDPVAVPGLKSVPEPKGRSHAEYGQLLGVGEGLSPMRPVSEAHLWYVVEDRDRLYGLLSMGIRRWGALESLEELGGLASTELSKQEFAVIAARAQVLEAVAQARSIGRGTPVTRHILENSGAVSEAFIDRVAELCEKFDGDARALLAAIDDGQVSRFRSDKRDELRDYLIEEGCLVEKDRLDPEEIWVHVLAAASGPISRGLIDESDVQTLLARAGGSEAR